MLALSSRVVRAHEPLSTEVHGETIMMDSQLGRYVNLDGVATAIWRELAEPIDVATLCDRLQARYAGDSETIRRDVLAFAAQLIENGLVRELD